MTVFTTNQHGAQQIIGSQQTQLVQQTAQQSTAQSQSVQQQTQQLQPNSVQLMQQTQQGQQPQPQPPQQTATVITTDLNKQVPIHITLPAQGGAGDSQPRILTIQVPASALQGM